MALLTEWRGSNSASSEKGIMFEEDDEAEDIFVVGVFQHCSSECMGTGEEVRSESRTRSEYCSRMVGGVEEIEERACDPSEKVAPSEADEAHDSGYE